jgi:hypothetical protein
MPLRLTLKQGHREPQARNRRTRKSIRRCAAAPLFLKKERELLSISIFEPPRMVYGAFEMKARPSGPGSAASASGFQTFSDPVSDHDTHLPTSKQVRLDPGPDSVDTVQQIR